MQSGREIGARGRLIDSALRAAGADGGPIAARVGSELGQATSDVAGFVTLVSEALGDADPRIRQAAAAILARFAAQGLPRQAAALSEALPTAVTALAEALHDTVPSVRVAAAEAAGHWGPGAGRLVPRLSLATEDADPQVQEAAARAIGRLGNDEPADAAQALAAIVGTSSRRRGGLVELAIRQLASCGPDAAGSAAPALVTILADRRLDLEVRVAAAETLRWLGPESATVVDQLVEVIIAGPSAGDEQVRTVAAAALVSAAVDPAGVAQRVRDAAGHDRLIEALRRVGPEATEFRRGVQAAWAAPTRMGAKADAPVTNGTIDTSASQPPTTTMRQPGMTHESDTTSSDATAADSDRLDAVEAGVSEIKQLLQSQQQSQPAEKELYTMREAAQRTDYSEWTLRQACNTGRIEGEKGVDGRWRISHETLREIRNRGLPP